MPPQIPPKLGRVVRRARLIALGLILASSLSAWAAEGPRPTVIILSFDGLRHDYPARVETPALDRMAREGARVARLIPCYPAQTFPTHACLATGLRADKHGILNNVFFDSKRGVYKHAGAVSWYAAPPLWIEAQRAGIRAHVYHWISSEGAYEGVEPAFWKPYDPKITDQAKLEAIAGWLERDEATRPGLIMTYLNGCDRAGHLHGPRSAEVEACTREADALVAQLMKAIEAQRGRLEVTLFVTSDHGMTETVGTLNPWRALRGAGLKADIYCTGPIAHIFAPEDRRVAIFTRLSAMPHVKVYHRAALPPATRMDHPTRTGDIVLIADPGHRFDQSAEAIYTQARVSRYMGHHGHDPTHVDMGAILYAWGARVRPGAALERAESVDLEPSARALLGLPPRPEADGRILTELIEVK